MSNAFPLVPVADPDTQFNFDQVAIALGEQQQFAPWIAPSLANGWTNQGGTLSTVAYYKDVLGRVWLRGSLVPGTSGVAFTLPVGYRPAADIEQGIRYYTGAANGLSTLYITASSGTVNMGGTAGTAYSLNGISFRAEQ